MAVPLASTVRAANGSPGTVKQSVTVFNAETPTTVTWKVSNPPPPTNGYNIIEFLVNAGGAGDEYPHAFSSCSDANGAFTASYPTAQVVDFTYNSPVTGPPITPGSYDVFTCTFETIAQSGAANADTFTMSYATQDTTHSGLVPAGSANIYVAAADATMNWVSDTFTPATIGVTPQDDDTLLAGTSVLVKWQITSVATPGMGVGGIPVAFTWAAAPADVATYGTTTAPTLTASGVTDATGKVSSTFVPDPVIADQTAGATVFASAIGATAGILSTDTFTAKGTYYLVTIAAAPVGLGVAINSLDLNPAQSAVPVGHNDITVSITDTYGNPAPNPAVGGTSVTLAAVNVVGIAAGWSTSLGFPPSHPVVSITVIIPHLSTGTTPGSYNYFFSLGYKDQSYITASASGYPTGSSKTITTWGFNFNGGADIVSFTPATPQNVHAGSTQKISVTLFYPQANVPINFSINLVLSSAKYAGTFSNGKQWIIVLTDSTGTASAVLTVDTTMNAFAYVSLSYPGNYPEATQTGGGAHTARITTISGPAIALVFLASYDNTCIFSPCNFASDATVTGKAVNGTVIYLDVMSVDIYGNPAVISTLSDTQVTLTPPTGLSASTLFIAEGQLATSGVGFGPIKWDMPKTIGTSVTLTATATDLTSATLTITTVSAQPTINVKSPTNVSGVLYSKYTAVTFSGTANASLGYAATGPVPPAGARVNVVAVGYSLNGAHWKTYHIPTPSPRATWSFAVNLNAGKNTVQFNATDSLGNVGVTSVMTVVVDAAAPTIGFTTKTGAVINAGSSVTAWAYDLEGDFDASSVVVKANNVALAASHVSVSGSNTLGANSSFAITISGLTAGTYTLSMTAGDLAGNVAAAVAITVTVNVPQGSTFTSPGASACTTNGVPGACITLTNNAATSQTVNIWFVWYNAQGQIVAITGQPGVTFASGASAPAASAFNVPGTYLVQVLVRDAATNAVALSAQYSVTVTVH